MSGLLNRLGLTSLKKTFEGSSNPAARAREEEWYKEVRQWNDAIKKNPGKLADGIKPLPKWRVQYKMYTAVSEAKAAIKKKIDTEEKTGRRSADQTASKQERVNAAVRAAADQVRSRQKEHLKERENVVAAAKEVRDATRDMGKDLSEELNKAAHLDDKEGLCKSLLEVFAIIVRDKSKIDALRAGHGIGSDHNIITGEAYDEAEGGDELEEEILDEEPPSTLSEIRYPAVIPAVTKESFISILTGDLLSTIKTIAKEAVETLNKFQDPRVQDAYNQLYPPIVLPNDAMVFHTPGAADSDDAADPHDVDESNEGWLQTDPYASVGGAGSSLPNVLRQSVESLKALSRALSNIPEVTEDPEGDMGEDSDGDPER
jgi:hypothetical protein